MEKRKLFMVLVLVAFFSNALMAQKTKVVRNGEKMTVNGTTTEIIYYSPSIVRILKYPAGTALEKVSLSIVKQPEKVKLTKTDRGKEMVFSSSCLSVLYDKTDGTVSFRTQNGEPLITEKRNSMKMTPIEDIGEQTFSVAQTFTLDADENIYGLGQQQNGAMNQRGQSYYLFNSNMYVCIPYIYSTKGYGLYWDNYSPTRFVDDQQGMLFDSEVGDCIDYYLIYGQDVEGTIAGIRDLTGEAPLYPLWTLGFWQCRERYESQAQLLEVLHKYRELQVPLDGIVQDWRYWGASLEDPMWNSMRFDNPLFPDPQAMVDEVHENHAHLMISVWPSFGPATAQYRELDSIGALISFSTWPTGIGVKPYDPFHPEAAKIYWKYLKEMHKLGIDAWWLDGTEPDHFDRQEKDMHNKMYYGSYRRMKNAYPIACNRNVYEALRKADTGKRAYLMTRSATFGQQRYASCVWSGDVVSNWTVFRNQIAAGQNFVLCGMPYWNTDIGGFFSWEYRDAEKNKAYQELHVRWLEFAAFTPIMRSHNSSPTKVEIYQFGDRGEWVFDAQEKFINLRYRLLPYTYSAAWQVTSESGNILRPLLMDFVSDERAQNIPNEYMYGKSFLVCAVTEPMYTVRDSLGNGTELDMSVAKDYPVYLPAGTSWYDFFQEKRYEGGQQIMRPVPIDELPLYVRAGSIIPLGPKVQYALEKPWDALEIKIYPGEDGRFTLYEDEFDSYRYEEGRYTTIDFEWDETARKLAIGKRNGQFDGMLKQRKFVVSVVGSGKTQVVDYSGKPVEVRF